MNSPREAKIGKRSDFLRVERDLYRTPAEAIPFLAPHLPKGFRFCEPCAADGTLTKHLQAIGGKCTAQYDIMPLADDVAFGRAEHMLTEHLCGADMIITNPPWARPILHRMIKRFSRLGVPCWLLFDADWAYTDHGSMFMDFARGRNIIHKIVAIGRLEWIPGSGETGKDNSAWYFVDRPTDQPAAFIPRLDVST